jgi:hypothetical protein
MEGRDFSSELFPESAPQGKDFSSELFPINNKPSLTSADKLIKGLRDPIDAGAQLLTNVLPKSLVNTGNLINNWLASNTGLVGKLPEGGIDQLVRSGEQQYEAQRKAQGDTGIDWYRMLGNIASPANLAIASKMPQALSLAGKIGTGVIGGNVSGALTPVSEGDFTSEKLKQIGISGLTGGIFPALTSAGGKIISPSASKNTQLALLKSEGVQPTVGQSLGGFANRFEEKLTSVPILGDAIAAARTRVNSQFEKAAYDRALEPIGKKLPTGISGRDAVDFAQQELSNQYDTVLNKIGAIKPDQSFNKNVAKLQNMVNRLGIPESEKDKFAMTINNIASSIDENGVITSEAYKLLESSLGSDARKLFSSQNIYEGKIAPAVSQLKKELSDMLKRQSGENADELKSVNAGYANFKRAQKASGFLGAEGGEFTPSQYLNAVRSLSNLNQFAKGSALGQDLADAGKIILGNKIPDSGTAGRVALGLGGLGAGAFNIGIPISLLGGASLYTPQAQRGLNWLISARPKTAEKAADILQKTTPFISPASSQLSTGLLNY